MTNSIDWNIDLNYKGENDYSSFFSTKGNFHAYPAKAVPQMVQTLIRLLKNNYGVKTILDPFVGSGTVALETKYAGLKFYGSDLNALSILLSKTKVLTVNNTENTIKEIKNFLNQQLVYSKDAFFELTYFENIDYWFLDKHIYELSFVKNQINNFLKKRLHEHKEQFALILLTAFSSTIRQASLTRNNEFKLYKMPRDKVKTHEHIDSLTLFRKNVEFLLDLLEKTKIDGLSSNKPEIFISNAKDLSYLRDKKVDLILTSPPYGDSKSTVSYGQFSKLSLQWINDLMYNYLDLKVKGENCDEDLLGGRRSITSNKFFREELISSSNTLRELSDQLDKKVNNDFLRYSDALIKIDLITQSIKNSDFYEVKKIIKENKLILEIFTARVRLSFYKDLKQRDELSDKETKRLSKEITVNMLEEFLEKQNQDIDSEITTIITDNLLKVKKSIKDKRYKLNKRREEILHFFDDLYEVIIKTDQVLNVDGIQAWIVGHRTVMGNININFEKILSEWFTHLGYKSITSLSRDYSYKRLPSTIRSTIVRNEDIQTMLQEHILIVQKNR